MKNMRKVKREKLTIHQWLERLPTPYKERAILNLLPTEKDKCVPNLKWALKSAFHWNDTPEGGEYWNEFADTL